MTNPVFVTDKTLARTFDGGAYSDAWEAVEQYRKATQYASKHGVKSGATASTLECEPSLPGHSLITVRAEVIGSPRATYRHHTVDTPLQPRGHLR